MSFDAGSIVGTLDLDRDPFQRKLAESKRQAAEFAKGKYAPTVDADTTKATAKVIDIRDRLARLNTQRVTPKLTVDNAAGLAKLVDFQEKLDRLRGKVASARVDADTDAAKAKLDALDIQLRKVGTITAKPKVTVEGVERANIQLDALELKLRALGATTARPNVATAGGGGGIFNRLAGYGRSGGFFSPSGLAGAAVFAAPAAVPIGVAALGAGASFLTPTVAGGLGLGLFGAASKSSVTRVDQVQQQLDKLNQKIAATSPTTTTTTRAASPAQINAARQRVTAAQLRLAQAQVATRPNAATIASATASVTSAEASLSALQGRGGTTTKANAEYEKLVKQRNALLKTLTPAERDAAEGVDRLEKKWVSFQKALEPQTFKAVAAGTDIATKGLNLMLPATTAVGKEVDTLAADADAALSKPFWKDFFGRFLTQEAPRAVDSLGRTIGHLADGFGHLTEDFAPLGHDLEDALVRWSGVFDKWTQGSGPEKFVKLVEQDGPVAARALGALADGAEGLANGLEPIGRIELEALTPVLDFIGDLGKQHPAVITALGVAYLGVAGGLKAMAAVKGLSSVLGIVKGLGSGGKPSLGGGGILGKLGAQGSSPANPLYVFVVDQAPGGGLPGVPGTKPGGKLAPVAGLGLPLIAAYIATQGGDVAPGQMLQSAGGQAQQALAKLLRPFGANFNKLPKVDQSLYNAAYGPNSGKVDVKSATAFLQQYNPKALDDLAAKYPQVAAAVKDLNKQESVLNQYLSVNTGLSAANARAADAQNAALRRELSTLQQLPTYLRDAEAAAQNGGFLIGKSLTDGITIGIQQGGGTVAFQSVKMVKGVLKASRGAAKAYSPSRETMRLGADMADGLALGYLKQFPVVVAAFKQSTGAGLLALKQQLATAQGQLQSDIAARTSAAQGISSNLSGAFSLSSAFGPYGNVLNLSSFFGAGAKTLRTEKALLARLQAKHLSPGLLAQIGTLSPQQAVAVETNILSGASGSIGSIDRNFAAMTAGANAIGTKLADAQYQQTIAHDQKMIHLLQQLVNALHGPFAKEIGAAVAAALNAVARGHQVHHP